MTTRCEWTQPGIGPCDRPATKTVLWTEDTEGYRQGGPLSPGSLPAEVDDPATNHLAVCDDHADDACLAFPGAAVFDLEETP